MELIETEPLEGTGLRLLSRLEALGFRIAVDDYPFARPLDRDATDTLLRGIGTEHWPQLQERAAATPNPR